MSKERIQIAPELFEIMPPEYQDLVSQPPMGMRTGAGRTLERVRS